jgi:hypothetical protein
MSNNKWLADLKIVLQIAKARLDVREKKKTEQVAKERYTVADYIQNNKTPRARIGTYLVMNMDVNESIDILAVEHLIREDYKIEAMDRIEAYLDTLLMRLQLVKDRPYVIHVVCRLISSESICCCCLEKMVRSIRLLNNH